MSCPRCAGFLSPDVHDAGVMTCRNCGRSFGGPTPEPMAERRGRRGVEGVHRSPKSMPFGSMERQLSMGLNG